MTKNNEECCPEFTPGKWEEKTSNWKNKPFIKESIPLLFHIPIYFPMIGKKIIKMMELAEKSNAAPPHTADSLLLFYDPHPFKSEIYLSVTGEVTGAENVKLSGKFISKVFDGPYNSVPKHIKRLNEYLLKAGEKAQKYYVHYAYCPKCAKKYGHNHMILFAQV